MDSPQGDYVGGGQNYYFTATDGTFSASKNFNNGVSISFNGSGHNWSLDFSAPGKALLTPGDYPGAARYPFQSSNQPGLSVSGDGRGSNTLTGFFTVKEIVYGSGNTIVAFDATFSQRSEGSGPPLTGEVLFNASGPLPPANHFTSELNVYATAGQSFTYQMKTTKPNSAYFASNLPTGLSLNSTTGLISGTPTQQGTFPVALSTTGSNTNNAAATLNLTITPPSQSTGAFTSLQMQSDTGDFVGQGKSYSFLPADGIFSASAQTNRVTVSFHNASYSENWTLIFTAPTGSNLGVGVYQNAARSASSAQPGLDVFGDGRGSNTLTGSFVIREISFDNNGQLQGFHASFIQHSEGAAPALTGSVWYQSGKAITSSLNVFGRDKRQFSYQIIANNQPSSFSATGLPAGITLDPQSGVISGTPTQAGVFNVAIQAVGSASTASDTLTLTINPSQSLANISTRLKVGTSDNVLIGGFIISGPEPKKVIIRAIGPSLTGFGVPGALTDPNLQLHNQAGTTLAMNDDWRTTQLGGLITANQRADIQGTGLAPTQDVESAILVTLAPGSYTAIVRGFGTATGIGLVEVYDLSSDANAKLANISSRGFVEGGDNVMIGGFIMGGTVGSGGAVVVRALGPSLAGAGVPNVMADPTLELHDSNGGVLAFNNDWKDSQETDIEATDLAPSKPLESAILTTLPPGGFTAIVRDKNGNVGNALVEVYNIK